VDVRTYFIYLLLTAVPAGLLVTLAAKIAIVQASTGPRKKKKRGRPAVTVTGSVGRRVGMALTSSSPQKNGQQHRPPEKETQPNRTQQNHGFRLRRESQWRVAWRLIHTDGRTRQQRTTTTEDRTGEWLARTGRQRAQPGTTESA
jgi:hypothetical protein